MDAPGGLIVRKDRPKPDKERRDAARAGEGSRLGLDKLAAEKRQERAEAQASQPMAPPPKRPFLSHLHEQSGSGSEGGAGAPAAAERKRYRRPRGETPTHAGGVNETAAARIAARVKERLKGDRPLFSSSGGGDGGGGSGRAWADASPAPSISGGDWEAPSPLHPSLHAHSNQP